MVNLDKLLDSYIKKQQFSGVLSFRDVQGSNQTMAFGLCDREKNILFQADMKLRIGSVSKNFTAAAILKLVEEQKITLQDKVSLWIPEYRHENLSLGGAEVTVHHLLSNTSGVPSYEGTDHAKESIWKKSVDVLTMVDKTQQLGLGFIPGTQYEYSNFGYNLLTLIIERASGKAFEVYLQQLLDKVGLKNTGVRLPRDEYLAKGYIFNSQNSHWESFYDYDDLFLDRDLLTFNGSGSMYSTVTDLLQWVSALREGKIISQSSLERMLHPNLNAYGYGWVLRSYGSESIAWHNGALSPVGVYAEVGWSLRTSFAFALLTNIDMSSQNPEVLKLIHQYITEACRL